eukprot:gene37886-42911_t
MVTRSRAIFCRLPRAVLSLSFGRPARRSFTMHDAIPTVTLPGGKEVPSLGFGTWMMGEDRSVAKAEVDAVRLALDLGIPADWTMHDAPHAARTRPTSARAPL